MQQNYSGFNALRMTICCLAAASGIFMQQQLVRSDEPSPEKKLNSILADELRAEAMAHLKIHGVLQQPTVIEFIETPLMDVIDYLEDKHGIQIELSTKALDAVGLGSDTPVTRHLVGIRLSSALKLLLSEIELTYIIREEVLQITTLEAADSISTTRVYNVADLLDEKRAIDDLVDVVTAATATHQHGSGTVVGFGTCLVATASQPQQYSIARLLAMLRAAQADAESGPVQNPFGLYPVNKERFAPQRAPKQSEQAEDSKPVEIADPFREGVPAPSRRKPAPKRDRDPFGGGADPFGGSGGDDPFGGAEVDNPFGKPVDPFGGGDAKRN